MVKQALWSMAGRNEKDTSPLEGNLALSKLQRHIAFSLNSGSATH